MKLLALDLRAFGCFSQTRLELDEARAFHLIYGDNEAGKSTALRALTHFFFGIPAATPDAFHHAGPELSIGAELRRADGEKLSAVRLKRMRQSLFDPQEEAIPEQRLASFIGGVSEEAFAATYRLDHETLVRGGDDLRAGRGDLAQSLFQAGAGLVGLRQTLADLEAEAGAIFKPQAQRPLINSAIEAYQSALRQSKELSVKPAEWARQKEEQAALAAELQKRQAELSAAQETAQRLERMQLAWPHAARLEVVRAELKALGEVVLLPESAPREREEAERALRQAGSQSAQARREIERLQEELAQLRTPEAVLRHAAAIGGLHQRLSAHREILSSALPRLRAERERDWKEAGEILRSLWPDATEAPTISALDRTRIEALAGRGAVLAQRALDAAARAAEAERELAEAQGPADLPPPPPLDLEPLRQALHRAQREGDLDARRSEAQVRLSALEHQAGKALTRLGRWRGTAGELEQLGLPAPETIDYHEQALAEAGEAERHAATAERQAAERVRDAEKSIRALELTGEIPTERELQSRRERREEGWRLVRRAWLEGVAEPAGEGRFHPEKPLAEAYEEAVAEADAVADRLRREGNRVGQLAQLLAGREECQRQLEAAVAAKAEAQKKRRAAEAAWEEVWVALGVESGSPREMRAWLLEAGEALRSVEEHARQQTATAQAQALWAAHAGKLREALRGLGEPPAKEAALEDLLELSGALLRRQEEARQQLLAWEAERKRLFKAAEKARREAGEAAEERKSWDAEWSAAVAPLGLAREPEPSEALAVMQQMERCQQKQREAGDAASRIQAMETAAEQFSREAAAVMAEAAPELPEVPADQAVVQLQARLAQAQKEEAHRERLIERLDSERGRLGEAAEAAKAEEEQLARLRKAAGCGDLEELRAAEEKSARARALQREMEELARTLAPMQGGLLLESFLAELQTASPDRLAAQAQEIAGFLTAARAAVDTLQFSLGRGQAELSLMDGGSQAARAMERAQQAAAEIESLAAQYVRLRVAAGVLRRQIDRYCEENQGPIIRRASELFPRLTRDSFAGLRTDFDEKDRPILLGVRPAGTTVPVAGMSEGTRDQLFLALRLASLEHQMKGCEPIPLLVDDILISFDDARAGETLRVLAEFSATTQVLFFTHHAHLVELAKAAVPADALQLHRLA